MGQVANIRVHMFEATNESLQMRGQVVGTAACIAKQTKFDRVVVVWKRPVPFNEVAAHHHAQLRLSVEQ